MLRYLMGFGENFPGLLKDMQMRFSINDIDCEIAKENRARSLSCSDTLYAAMRMYEGLDEQRKVFTGLSTKGEILVEIEDGKTIQALVFKTDNDGYLISACEVDAATGVSKEYSKSTRSGTLVLFGFLEHFFKNEPTVTSAYTELKKAGLKEDPNLTTGFFSTFSLLDDFSRAMCRFTNEIYFRVKHLEIEPMIKKLRQADLKKYPVKTVITGTPKVFAALVKEKKRVEVEVGKYPVYESTRVFTPEEQALIPIMSPEYILPEWVENIAHEIKLSNRFKQRFRNVCLCGEAGSGKTTGAQAMAALLGLPYVHLTCSPGMETMDFVGQFIPNTGEKGAVLSATEICNKYMIPTFDDVENDYENTYQILFGRSPDKYSTPAECYTEIMNMVLERVGEGKDFRYIKSELVMALENGWFCEIQEPTIIRKPAVMVALNSILEVDTFGASMALVNGETIRRHPDTVLCLTTNLNYEGCKGLQQSVLSRINIMRTISTPSEEELAERVFAQTGYEDKTQLTNMVKIVNKINEYCREKNITDGVCGVRELIDWVKATMIRALIKEEDLKAISTVTICEAAFETILAKVSFDENDKEDVITSCVATTFTSSDIEEARMEMAS